MKEDTIKKIRKIIAIIVLILFIIGLIKMLPTFLNLVTEEGRLEFEDKIKDIGIIGPLWIVMLEICKIILVFLPGEPIELLAGMCYGPFVGFLTIYVGVVISNILIILAVKKYGTKLVKDIVQEEKILKVEKMINDHPDKSDFTLFVLYFLPILPKDLITYVASLLPISKGRIFVISLIGRFTPVLSSILVGSRILDGDLKSIIMIYALTYIISGFIVWFYNKNVNTKRKEQKDD